MNASDIETTTPETKATEGYLRADSSGEHSPPPDEVDSDDYTSEEEGAEEVYVPVVAPLPKIVPSEPLSAKIAQLATDDSGSLVVWAEPYVSSLKAVFTTPRQSLDGLNYLEHVKDCGLQGLWEIYGGAWLVLFALFPFMFAWFTKIRTSWR